MKDVEDRVVVRLVQIIIVIVLVVPLLRAHCAWVDLMDFLKMQPMLETVYKNPPPQDC